MQQTQSRRRANPSVFPCLVAALLQLAAWLGTPCALGAEAGDGADRSTVQDHLKALDAALSKAGVDKESQKDADALRDAAKKADAELVAAIRAAAERLAADAAMAACTKPKLQGCAGEKEKALERIAALVTAFERFPAAGAILTEARDEIENDKPGVILGDWWNGAALGVAYYTGPGSTKFWWFEKPGQEVAKSIGLPYQEIHAADVIGGADDENGILLYPDGTARVRFLLMPGGDPGTVTRELGNDKGCAFMRSAFASGMDYVGICSGCCLVMESCFKLWPGRMSRTNPTIKGPPHDIVFLPFHPLARIYGNGAIAQVPFTGGINEMTANAPNTEYIGFFRNGQYEGMEGKCAVMAYSPPGYAGGRLVVCPAHPEAKDPKFIVAMANYALRHPYALPRHRVEIGQPVKGVCGDHQNQYYEVLVRENVDKLEVVLGDLDGDCKLSVSFGDPPKPVQDSIKPPKDGKKRPTKSAKKPDRTKSISRPKPGVYFIMIHGDHDNLNGVNYTLTVSAGSPAPAAAQ